MTPTDGDVRRGSRDGKTRRRWLAAIACVAALALVGVIAFAQLTRTGSHSRRTAATQPARTGSVKAVTPPPANGGKPTVPVTVSAGGTAQLSDGTRVVIPPNAVSHNGTLQLKRTHLGSPSNTPPGIAALGAPLHIMLTGATLTGHATLTIPAAPPKDWPSTLAFKPWVSSYDEQAGQWTPQAAAYDAQRNLVTLQVSHFSWWNPFTWDYQAIAQGIRKTVADMSETPSGCRSRAKIRQLR